VNRKPKYVEIPNVPALQHGKIFQICGSFSMLCKFRRVHNICRTLLGTGFSRKAFQVFSLGTFEFSTFSNKKFGGFYTVAMILQYGQTVNFDRNSVIDLYVIISP